MQTIKLTITTGSILLSIILNLTTSSAQDVKYNVLLIMVDDLKPELGCYGNQIIKTPNIDKLAKQGTLFNQAYCQQAVCSPSRVSFLTGLRPDSTRVYDLSVHFRSNLPNAITMPQYFKQNGYLTQRYGKVFHSKSLDDPESWSFDDAAIRGSSYSNQENRDIQKLNNGIGPSHEVGENSKEHNYRDSHATKKLIEDLNTFGHEKFFFAVGYYKPHLPFSAPKKYWDLYSDTSIPLGNGLNDGPICSPAIAKTDWQELRTYIDIPNTGPLNDSISSVLKKGYYACVSFIDDQIGQIMKELESLDLISNTIVVLWGDHGYKLGEYGMWCKHTNYEIDTRVPLIISGPALPKNNVVDEIVESIDVFPTLASLIGDKETMFSGMSLEPILSESNKHKKFAISQYPRDPIMGYSFRSKEYRLITWVYKKETDDPIISHQQIRRLIQQGVIVSVELYDQLNDPGELNNICSDESKPIIDSLMMEIEKHTKFRFPRFDDGLFLSIEKTSTCRINIYPNPSQGDVNIQITPVDTSSFKSTVMHLYSVDGNLVKSYNIESTTNVIKSRDLPESGMYVAVFETGGFLSTKKLILQ